MLSKTQALVLHTTSYNDRWVIVHLFTEQFGRTGYLVAKPMGRRRSSSVYGGMLYAPFSVIEIETDHRFDRQLQKIKEAQILFSPNGLQYDPIKGAVTLFLAEFLFKTLREGEVSPPLFTYLRNSVELLDAMQQGKSNFHLVFLLQMARFFGFYPNQEEFRFGCFFDLLNGCYVLQRPLHNHFLVPKETLLMHELMRINFQNLHLFQLGRNDRVLILNHIIDFYRLHHINNLEIKSLDILNQLFD